MNHAMFGRARALLALVVAFTFVPDTSSLALEKRLSAQAFHGRHAGHPTTSGHGEESSESDAGSADSEDAHGAADPGASDAGHGSSAASGHGGHGGHGHDPSHAAMMNSEEPTAVSTAVAIMLLGMMAFQMATFYMVKYPDPGVQRFTWACMSTTVSIFAAVLIYTALKDMLLLPFKGPGGEVHAPSGAPALLRRSLQQLSQSISWFSDARSASASGHEVDVVGSAYVFFMLFFLAQGSFIALRWRQKHLKPFAMISAHVLGFAALEIFGGIQQGAPWRSNCFTAFACAVLCGCVIYVMCHSTTKLRRLIDNSDDHDAEHWREECCEAEDEFAGFVLGLLVSTVVRFAITGDLPPVHGNPFGKSMTDVWCLFGVSWLFGILLMISTVVCQRIKAEYEDNAAILRATDVIQETVSMSFGWCFLFWSRWLFWASTNDQGVGGGELVTARVIQALGVTVFVFAGIFGVDFFCDTLGLTHGATKTLQNSFGLVLGLSWEGAFGEAILAIGRNYDDSLQRLAMDNLVGFWLCVLVIPAWAMYILPDTKSFKQLAHDSHTHKPGHGPASHGSASVMSPQQGTSH